MTGSNLTCAQLADVDGGGVLRSRAGCPDEGVCDAELGVALLGNEVCDESWVSRGTRGTTDNTAECSWDGGGCE